MMLEEYRPENAKTDRYGNKKAIGRKNDDELVIKSKYWRKVSHILNIGGCNYLNYMVAPKPSG